jgi:GNAT superfamily N-acetyltransferase
MGLILLSLTAAVGLTLLLIVRRRRIEPGFNFKRKTAPCHGSKFVCVHEGREVARTYLYVLRNDLHEEPFGFIEDVFVEPKYRGQGLVSRLHEMAVDEARANGCYKIVLSSRAESTDVHDMYKHLGYAARGVAFRLDLKK